MTREIHQIKKSVLPILKKSGVKRSAIFGSFARGEATKKSDVDFLIEPPKRFTLLDLIHLEHLLKNKLGRDVDVIPYKSIYPPLRERILNDAVEIL
jgi:predicted nucleotidyltransferase